MLSGSGVFQRGDLTADHALIADHALSRRVEAAALAVPVAGQATPARGARRKVSFADAQSGGPEGSAGRDSKENKGRAPQPVAEGAGREEKALRLSKDAMELAHLRLGHASKQRIIELAKSGAVQGFSLQTISREPADDDICESCLAGNWRTGPLDPGGLSGRESLLRGPSKAKLPEAGSIVGCDLFGPINIELIDHTRYLLALYDIVTGFWMMYRLLDASAKATAAALRPAPRTCAVTRSKFGRCAWTMGRTGRANSQGHAPNVVSPCSTRVVHATSNRMEVWNPASASMRPSPGSHCTGPAYHRNSSWRPWTMPGSRRGDLFHRTGERLRAQS